MNEIIVYFKNGDEKHFKGDYNFTGDFVVIYTNPSKYIYSLGNIFKIDCVFEELKTPIIG